MVSIAKFRQLLNALIEVKTHDSDDARRRRLLNIILTGLFLLTLLTLALIIAIEVMWADEFGIVEGENTWLYTWILAIMAGYVFFYALNRKLPNGIAGFLFLLFLLVSFAFSDEAVQLVDGRSLYVFTIPILLSSVLVRP
ncbi:MAG TPA: hypothetical protein DCG54_02650, partial [Anaerolineae bacterium]|nr:hypothetical protein [Anaerolineae bacterium]